MDPTNWITAGATAVIAAFTAALFIATNRQAKLTRQALITTERAFVFLEDFDCDLSFQSGRGPNLTVTRLTVRPRWRNNGTTPTRNMRVAVNWSHWSGPMPTGFDYAYGDSSALMFLGPQATEWSAPIEIPPHVATAALSGNLRIFIWGRVDYQDIFNDSRPHFTEWCYRLHIRNVSGKVETQFIAEGEYNRSDEDSENT